MNLEELRQEVLFHDEAYENGSPVITDTEYEGIYRELQRAEQETGDISPDSPTQKITYLKVDGLESVEHTVPMLSLDKTNKYDGLKKWYAQSKGRVMVQPKLDGLTIVLRFSDGKLVDAITRGNGFEGQRVMHTISTIKSLPPKINFEGDLEVRGEAYIPFAEFNRVNNGEYANPRSLAAGTVQMLDASIAAQRGLAVQIFDLINAEGKEFSTGTEQNEFLSNLGFPVVETIRIENLDNIAAYCAKYETETRPTLPFPIDGLVLKYEDLDIRERLDHDSVSKNPKSAVAFKFSSEEAFTTLNDIIVQVGKTGQLCPVACFSEISIGGVDISKATLHNPKFVYDNDIRISDRILVARANDVIPRVMKSFPEYREEDTSVWKMPESCPQCGTAIEFRGPLAFCTNRDCPGQLREQIIHYCSRDALDIDGIGDSNANLFFEMGYLKTPADLYTLHEKADELSGIEGFGSKKVDKILAGIEKSKNLPLSRVLYALNIPHLGRSNSRTLAEKFLSIDSLASATRAQLVQIDGIGDVMADTIIEFFSDERNQSLISRLKDAGVNMADEKPVSQNTDLPLAGKIIVVTGTLSITRNEVEQLIRNAGAKASGSVSKRTDFVILGPDKSGSGKHRKAMELGVRIISEAEFRVLLEGGSLD